MVAISIDSFSQSFGGTILVTYMTPRAIRTVEEFPLLVNQMLHVAVQLAPDGTSDGQPRLAIIPLGRALPRFFTLTGGERGYWFVLLEDVVVRMVHRFFPGEKVLGKAVFRITRNADFSLRDDLATDLLAGMTRQMLIQSQANRDQGA